MTARRAETLETRESARTTVTTITMITDRGFRLLVRIPVFLRRLLLLLRLFLPLLLSQWFRLLCRPLPLRHLVFWVRSPTLTPFLLPSLRPFSVVPSLPQSQKLRTPQLFRLV
jgi:hypothetical protein